MGLSYKVPRDPLVDKNGNLDRSFRLFLQQVANHFTADGEFIMDLSGKGMILKDSQATPHYWRVYVDNTGAVKTSDLGTDKP